MVKNAAWWDAAPPDYQAADFAAGVEVRNPSGLNGTYSILNGRGRGLEPFLHFRDRSRGLL